jgi:hypothetical protein
MAPVDVFSRYRFCKLLTDEGGRAYLSERTPYGYRQLADTIPHTAVDGDTWWGLAGRYYKGYFPQPSMLYDVLCDFQPVPVVDPTVVIEAGTLIYIPHPTTVSEKILNEQRRFEPED